MVDRPNCVKVPEVDNRSTKGRFKVVDLNTVQTLSVDYENIETNENSDVIELPLIKANVFGVEYTVCFSGKWSWEEFALDRQYEYD